MESDDIYPWVCVPSVLQMVFLSNAAIPYGLTEGIDTAHLYSFTLSAKISHGILCRQLLKPRDPDIIDTEKEACGFLRHTGRGTPFERPAGPQNIELRGSSISLVIISSIVLKKCLSDI